jgi:hypothetical protein
VLAERDLKLTAAELALADAQAALTRDDLDAAVAAFASAATAGASPKFTARVVDPATIPMLFKTVASNKIDPMLLITHHFTLDDGEKAYATFGNAAETKALKVIITM